VTKPCRIAIWGEEYRHSGTQRPSVSEQNGRRYTRWIRQLKMNKEGTHLADGLRAGGGAPLAKHFRMRGGGRRLHSRASERKIDVRGSENYKGKDRDSIGPRHQFERGTEGRKLEARPETVRVVKRHDELTCDGAVKKKKKGTEGLG